MSNTPSDGDHPQSDKQESTSGDVSVYGVGYGKPPIEHRFKKGQSGNPSGRPKGRGKNSPTNALVRESSRLFRHELNRKVKVREGSTELSLTALQAHYRKTVQSALKGDRHAQKWINDRLEREESEVIARHKEQFVDALSYQANWDIELQTCRANGVPEPTLIPHPHDIVFDYENYTYEVHGPVTAIQKRDLDERLQRRAEHLKKVSDIITALKKDPSQPRLCEDLQRHYSGALRMNNSVWPRYQLSPREYIRLQIDVEEIIEDVEMYSYFNSNREDG